MMKALDISTAFFLVQRRTQAVALFSGIVVTGIVIFALCWLYQRNRKLLSLLKLKNTSIEEEKKVDTLFENLPIGLALFSYTTRSFLEVNAKFCQIVGERKDYLLSGIGFIDILPADVYTDALEDFQDIMAGKKKQIVKEYKHVRQDGSAAWTLATITPVSDLHANDIKCIAIVEDITEKTENIERITASETALKTANARLGSIINSIDGIVWTANPQTLKLEFFNGKMSEMSGLDENDFIGLEVFNPDVIPVLDMDPSPHIVRQKIRAGEEVVVEYRAPTGSDYGWFRDRVNFIREKGKIISILGIATDITDLKRSEAELNQSLVILSDQNKRLLNFSYIVSHNLRAHSSNILSLCELAQETECNEEKTMLLNTLSDVAHLLNNTMDGLNEVISIHTRLETTKQPINLKKQIDYTLSILMDQIKLKSAVITNNVEDNIIIDYNKSYIESILLNLISNALRYSDPERLSQITINYTIENAERVMAIADNGIGMDLETNGHKLFGLFKTFSRNPDSKGVGLYITKNQVEAMGGRIAVDSKPGVGTAFKIYFA